MKFNFKLLKEICEAPGVPGYEQPIRKLILKLIKPHVDHIEIDPMGNIIALKKGTKKKKNPPKVMVAAHMDEIGFVTSYIEKEGFLRITPLGGFDPKTLCSQRVVVYGKGKPILGVMGTKPIHAMDPEERKRMPKVSDFYVDTGLEAKEVHKKIEIGSPISRHQELITIGNHVTGKSLDNRICVYVLIETLKALKNHECDFYALFSTQEEVGIRGARVASHAINPDFGIALDITLANDLPGISGKDHVTKLGEGPAIKVADRSTIANSELVEYMKKCSKKIKIPYQLEVMPGGGTDCSGMQYLAGTSAICGALSIPTRYVHSTTEMANIKDTERTVKLLTKLVLEMQTLKVTHL